jgi:hypothetical protein
LSMDGAMAIAKLDKPFASAILDQCPAALRAAREPNEVLNCQRHNTHVQHSCPRQ